jgi:hypothetical protein
LQPGKPAERLSAHYQLDCDYGTALITIYRESDGNEPVYLCEAHVAEVARSGEDRSNARMAGTEQIRPADPPKPRVAPAKSDPGNSIKPAVPSPEASLSRSAAKTTRSAEPVVRGAARDITYGNCAKALVDEAIWNLPTGDCDAYSAALQQGKSILEAAQAAGGQLAIVHRKIAEYTAKLEVLLSQSAAKINVRNIIDKPLEQATLDIIANTGMADAEKDRAIDQLGAFQEWIHRGINEEISPLEAHRIAFAVAERVNWGATTDVPDTLLPAHRAVYISVRDAVRTAVPDALAERLSNLYAAKSDLENTAKPKALHPQTI